MANWNLYRVENNTKVLIFSYKRIRILSSDTTGTLKQTDSNWNYQRDGRTEILSKRISWNYLAEMAEKVTKSGSRPSFISTRNQIGEENNNNLKRGLQDPTSPMKAFADISEVIAVCVCLCAFGIWGFCFHGTCLTPRCYIGCNKSKTTKVGFLLNLFCIMSDKVGWSTKQNLKSQSEVKLIKLAGSNFCQKLSDWHFQ